MPLPLMPIISALAAGGTLVPHAAGGMIVTSATGYVTGTYLSTAAIGSLLTVASTTFGVFALYLSGTAASIIGSSGIFGTSIGASGITGALISVGIIASTPIWLPIVVVGAAIWFGYVSYRMYMLKQKISITEEGEEANFIESEAKMIEKIIKRLDKNNYNTKNNESSAIKKIKKQPWF